jgi:hypothetical protein
MSGIPAKKASSANAVEGSMHVAIHLPHVVYILSKNARVQKSDISMTWEGNMLKVENHSREYIRAMALDVHYDDGRKLNQGSFPLFPIMTPGHAKTFGPFTERPSYVILRFDNFSIDSRKD